MSFLKDMIDKAKGYLSSHQPTVADAVDAIHQDRFDRATFDELVDEVPAISDLIQDLNERYDYTEDMVADAFASFWQADPALRPQGEMHPRLLTNHAVASDLVNAPETTETRALTKHDKYGAAMATLGVSERVRSFLQENQEIEEAAKEAERAKQEAKAAQDNVEQQVQQAEDAQQAAEDALGDFNGCGPLTKAQSEAQTKAEGSGLSLQQAMELAEAAAKAAAKATEAAQEAAAEAKQALRQPIREAVKEVGDQLAEEGETFRAWGIGEGELQRMSFTERARLAARLRANRLAPFVKQLGRFRMMAAAQRAKKVEFGRDEIYGVEMSDRLPDVLGSEFAYLINRHTRLDFLSRLAEGRLLSRKYRGVEKEGKGAIIALVDTSGSMTKTDRHGVTREAWSKAFALALLDQARASNRDFVGIIFANSRHQQVFRFPKGKGSVQEVLDFTELFFNGGTDFATPLDLATDILDQEFNASGKMKGDLVLITDDECSVTPDWTKKFLAAKAKLGFRLFGVAVGAKNAGSTLTALSDNVRAVDEFIPEQVADIIHVV